MGWHGIDLFEDDTKAFLTAGRRGKVKICRSIIRLDRDCRDVDGIAAGPSTSSVRCRDQQKGVEATLGNFALKCTVLNIWQASWDDVEYTRGVVGA